MVDFDHVRGSRPAHSKLKLTQEKVVLRYADVNLGVRWNTFVLYRESQALNRIIAKPSFQRAHLTIKQKKTSIQKKFELVCVFEGVFKRFVFVF
jgi:hypothetical protein